MFTARQLREFNAYASSLILLVALCCSPAWAQSSEYTVAPTPEWVKPTTPFDPNLVQVAEPTYGFHSRVHDFQYNGIELGNSRFYNAVEYVLTNQYGVENFSSIELSFDPVYEQLALHELTIKRGDTLIDKFSSARFDLLRTESDRSELIYDGTRTLAIVFDDVRVGDIIRYAYSVDGENPIFQGHREFRVHTQLWNALDRQYTRILTSTDKPLNRRIRGDNVPLQISEKDGVEEIVIDQRGVPEFDVEDDVPSWHYNRGTIVFSDMADWRSVVEWALPMYQLPEESVPEITTIASGIAASHEEVGAQVGAALRWVQEEVRYFGVELGKNSHWPSRPEETLARRFGDCKDKALLLIALLKELGVEASPALVNTDRGLEAASYPYRMHAFDHVIVHVSLDGESHFIDPTRRNQSGALGDMHEPDYGRALLLKSDTTGLTEMGNMRSRYVLNVAKELVVPMPAADDETQTAAQLTVKTLKQGRLAEHVRYQLETKGRKAISQDYLEYYQDDFDGIESTAETTFTDADANQLRIVESYSVDDFWMADENVDTYRWIHADEIMGYLDEPDDIQGRDQPYAVMHPIVIEETWVVSLPEKLRTDDLEAQFQNAWVSFSKQSSFNEDESELTVTFRYSTLTPEVAAEDLQAYADSVTKIEDMASFYLEHQPRLLSAKALASELTHAGALSFWFCLPGLLFPLLRERRIVA